MVYEIINVMEFMQLNVTPEIMSFVARFMDHFRRNFNENFNVIRLWNSVICRSIKLDLKRAILGKFLVHSASYYSILV
jgi:hypothetical protein